MARAAGRPAAGGTPGCRPGFPGRPPSPKGDIDRARPMGRPAGSNSSMSDRARKIVDFLESQGWAAGKRVLLAGDASFRRYERLTRGRESVVLMDAPPPQE